jgi:hypothetical protein
VGVPPKLTASFPVLKLFHRAVLFLQSHHRQVLKMKGNLRKLYIVRDEKYEHSGHRSGVLGKTVPTMGERDQRAQELDLSRSDSSSVSMLQQWRCFIGLE